MLSATADAAILALTCLYTCLRGGSDERIASLACVLSAMALELTAGSQGPLFAIGGQIGIEAASLTVFISLALTSDRFWPIWLAGLKLASVMTAALGALAPGHLPPSADFSRGFDWMSLALIAAGVWRGDRNRSRPQRHPKP